MSRDVFVLKARITSTEHSAGARTSPGKVADERVAAFLSPLYGFRFEYEGSVLLGESLTPVTAAHAEGLMRRWRAGSVDPRLLGNSILVLAIVSGDHVDLTSSICCCRPVYYCYRDRTFYCSTSIRALRDLGVKLHVDEETFGEFLVYRYVLPPRTLYGGISKLIGGQSIRIDLNDGRLVHNSYFRFARASDDPAGDPSATPLRLDELLREQLALSLQSRSRPGVLLSGGVDSGLLASIALKVNSEVTSTSSSFGFVDRSDAETDYALSFARHLGIAHEVYGGSEEEYLSGLVESIYLAEEPVHHLQSVMLYLLFTRHARGRYDLLVCGEGADGLFGNDLHSLLYRRRRLLAVVKALRANSACRWLTQRFRLRDYRWQLVASDYGVDVGSNHHVLWSLGRYGDPALAKKHFGTDDEAILGSHKALVQHYEDYGLLDQTTITSLLCEGFVSMYVWSKLAESQGIVVVYPFPATSVVDYVTSVPWPVKLRETKHLIRALLRRYGVPEGLVTRPKLSFGFPYRCWALPGALFQPIVDMAAEMFDPALLRSLQTEEPGRAMLLWNLINLFLWHKLLIEQVSVEALSAEVLERHAARRRLRSSA